jgi:hypothetical protein
MKRRCTSSTSLPSSIAEATTFLINPESRQIVPLFNPREHLWTDHFELRWAVIVGRTPTGQATVAVLAMNAPYQVDFRTDLIAAGQYPLLFPCHKVTCLMPVPSCSGRTRRARLPE